ncbi:MAG: Yip1 family protein [Mangrovibacterium sp.]
MTIKQLTDEIIQTSKEIVLSPQTFWQDKNRHAMVNRVFLFSVLLSGVASFLGNLMWSKSFLWSFALGKAIREIVADLLMWFVASFIIKKLSENFGAKTESGVVSSVVAWSLLPVVLIAVVVSLIPWLNPLQFLGLYAFYLFYLGVKSCFNLPEANLSRYVLLAIVLIVLVSGLVHAASWSIFKFVFPHGV